MTESYIEFIKYLDTLLEFSLPNDTDLEILKSSLQNPYLDDYFFSRLKSDSWFIYLDKYGFFKDLNRYPARYQYLQSMTASHPWPVTFLLRHQTPEDHTLGAAFLTVRQLPAPALWSLAPILREWITRKRDSLAAFYWMHIAEDYVRLSNDSSDPLVTSLAEFTTRELLMPWLEQDDTRMQSVLETHLDVYHISEFLKKYSSTLYLQDWYPKMLCEVLASFCHLRQLTDREEDAYYRVNRPHLDYAQRYLLRPDDAIVSALYALIQTKPTSDALWNLVGAQPYSLFRRFKLLWLSQRLDAPMTWVRPVLLDRYTFDSFLYEEEYTLAATQHFRRLDAEDQATILQWVSEPPITAGWRRLADHTPDSDDFQRWQWRLLHKLGPDLPPTHRQLLSDLSSRFGVRPEPVIGELIEQEGSRTTWTLQDLQQHTTPEDLIALLQSPPPETGSVFDRLSDRIEGVSDLIAQDVSQRPDFYVNALPQWLAIPPIYLSLILSGIRQHFAQIVAPSWQPFIETLSMLNGQIITDPAHQEPGLDLRGQLCTLLEVELLKNDRLCAEGLGLAEAIVEAVLPVLADVNPQPDETDSDVKRFGDPFGRSLNVTRGKAVHTVVALIAWLTDADDRPPSADIALQRLKDALLSHYDTEGSSAVFAAPAPSLPYLHNRDPEWFAAFWPKLLLDSPFLLGAAAWDAYLTQARYISALFQAIRPAYERYAPALVAPDPQWPFNEQTQTGYGRQLMIFYVRGVVLLDDSLLVNFFQQAPAEHVRAALSYLGDTLRREKDLEPEPLARAVALWTYISGPLVEMRAEAAPVFLKAFVSWYTSNKFDPAWALDELLRIAEQTPLTALAPLYPHLNAIAEESPLKVLHLLTLLVKHGEMYRHEVLEFRTILETLKSHQTPAINQAVNTLVDTLLSFGMIDEFRTYYRPAAASS